MCLGGIRSGWHSPPGVTLHQQKPNSSPGGLPKAQEGCTSQRTGGRGRRSKHWTGSATYRRVLNYVCTNPGSLDHKVSGPYHSTSLEVSELTRGVIINGVKWYPDSYGETDDYAFKVLHMYVVTVKDLEIGVFEVDKHIFCNCDHDDDIVPGVRKVRAVAGEVCLVLCESIRHLVTLYIDDRYPSVGTAVRVKDTTELEASDDVYVD